MASILSPGQSKYDCQRAEASARQAPDEPTADNSHPGQVNLAMEEAEANPPIRNSTTGPSPGNHLPIAACMSIATVQPPNNQSTKNALNLKLSAVSAQQNTGSKSKSREKD